MKTKKLIAVILVVLTVVYCGIAALLYDASSGVEMIRISRIPASIRIDRG